MKLNNKDIGKVVEDAEKFFKLAGVSRKDKIKIFLILEESLLRFQEKFGEDKNFTVVTKKLFRTPRIIIRVKGEPFNPLDSFDEEEDSNFLPQSIMKNLLHYETAGMSYHREGGYNELCIFSTKEKKPVKIPGGSITIATVLAIIVALVARFLPQDTQTFLIDKITTPLFQSLMGVILAVNIPLIFISIVSSVCAMENVTTLNKVGTKVIGRLFALMFIISVVAIGACDIFFPVISFEGKDKFSLDAGIELFLSILPTNIFKSFVEGHILQIVMISLLSSACIVIFGDRVSNLKNVINETRSVIFKMMEIVLKLLPLTIFLIVFKTILTTTLADILAIWKVVASSYLTYIVVSVLMLVRLSIKYKVGIVDFLRKNSPTLIVSFTTGSGTASMATNFDVGKKNLKIDGNFCDFWIPLSHALFSPGTVISMVVYAFFGAQFSGESISVIELLIISFLSIQLSICSPKVSGGNIALLTLLFTQLGFSLEAIGTLVIADNFINNISGVFGMLVRNCELFDIAHVLKLNKA